MSVSVFTTIALPSPVVAGLLIGPGLAAHCVAKQSLSNFNFNLNIERDLALCTFSATVSCVVAFALIESVAIVAAVGFATFSVLIAYEHFHLEVAKQTPPASKPIEELITNAKEDLLTKLLEAIGKLPQEKAASVDLQPIQKAVSDMQTAVLESIWKLPQENAGPVDLQPIQKAVSDMQTVVLEAIGKLPQENAEPVNLQPIQKAVSDMQTVVLESIGKLPQENAEPVNLQPIQEVVADMQTAVLESIRKLPQEDAEPVDLQPIQKAVSDMQTAVLEAIGKLSQENAEPVNLQSLEQKITSLQTELTSSLSSSQQSLEPQEVEQAPNKTDQKQLKVVNSKLKKLGDRLRAVEKIGATFKTRLENVDNNVVVACELGQKSAGSSDELITLFQDLKGGIAELKGMVLAGQQLADVKESISRMETRQAETMSTFASTSMMQPSMLGNYMDETQVPGWPFSDGPVSAPRSQGAQNIRMWLSPEIDTSFGDMSSPRRGMSENDQSSPVRQEFQVSTPETVKRRVPPPTEPLQSLVQSLEVPADDLKSKIIQEGGERYNKDYEDMNPQSVPSRYSNNALAKGHFFVNRDLTCADASAILHILDQNRLDINATFIAVPKDASLGFGSGRFSSLMQTDFTKQTKHSALTLAAQDGQADLLEYFMELGAPRDHVVEERCFLGFAAAAGLAEVIEKYADNDFGIGKKTPLIFDAICAEDGGATLGVLIRKGLYRQSINNTCGCITKHKDRIGRVVPRGTVVNAVHLAILLREPAKVEALLGCDSIVWSQKTVAKSGGSEASPLLLLLDWIKEERFEPNHWAVQAATAVIGKLKAEGKSSRVIRDETGKWYEGHGRHATAKDLNCTKLIQGCLEETQTALNKALN